MAGFSSMVDAAGTKQLKSKQKQVCVFWMTGGLSQLESWDPKPGVETGGPFQAIPTSVPGVHISELLPHTAKQMHHLALVRGINTKENNHAKGDYIMQTGYRETPGFEYPYISGAMSYLLSPSKPTNNLPTNFVLQSKTDYNVDDRLPREASFLGAKHSPIALRGTKPPENLVLNRKFSHISQQRRQALRKRLNKSFALGKDNAQTEIFNASIEQAQAMMSKRNLFNFGKLPAKDLDRYGKHPFGKNCLMARQLLENGIPFVKVRHTDYDSHSENFNFHLEQVKEEWDKPFALFVSDLADRGMLDHVLIIVMCEFGRTPRINQRVGRDHWGTAWSVALGGTGIKKGAVVGKTNAKGTAVTDREVNGGHLFHTYYQALGIDPKEDFEYRGRPFHKADPKASAIKEILA